MRAQLTSLTSAILFASRIQHLPPLFKTVLLHVGTFTFTMDVSSETSTPCAPVPRLCPGLMSLQCGLPPEDWDNHPLCASCQVLDDPPCQVPLCLSCLRSVTQGQETAFPGDAEHHNRTERYFVSFLPPPRPELTFILFSTLGRSGPAACPLSARTTAVHGVHRPATLTTGHPVFCPSSFGLPGVRSTQRGGEGFDPAFDGSCPGMWLGRACASLLMLTSTGLTPRVSWSPGLHNPRGQAQHSHHNGHRRLEDTSTHVSLPCHPGPVRSTIVTDVTVAAAHARLCHRASSGDCQRTSPYVQCRSPGASTPGFTVSITPSPGRSSKATPTPRQVWPAPKQGNSHTGGQPPCPGFPLLLCSPSARRRN